MILNQNKELDWKPKGAYPANPYKFLSPPARAVSSFKAKRPKAAPETICAPIPDVNLGDDVVIVQCLVQSSADKRGIGIWHALEHPSTKHVCFVFKIATKVIVWTNAPLSAGIAPGNAAVFTGPCPAPVADAIVPGATFLCNSLVVDRQMYLRLGWPEPTQWSEAAAILAAQNYHRSIDRSAAVILGCTQAGADRLILRSFWARKSHLLRAEELKLGIELCVRRVHLIAAIAAFVGHQPGIDEDARLKAVRKIKREAKKQLLLMTGELCSKLSPDQRIQFLTYWRTRKSISEEARVVRKLARRVGMDEDFGARYHATVVAATHGVRLPLMSDEQMGINLGLN